MRTLGVSIFLLFLVTLHVRSQNSIETPKKYASPFILTSWDGGINSDKKNGINYQNISFYCHTLGVIYDKKLEFGFSITTESNYTLLAKYHFYLTDHFIISPSLLGLKESALVFNTPLGRSETLKLNPGISAALKYSDISLRFSYYKIGKINPVAGESIINEFYAEEIGHHIFSIQSRMSFDKSLISFEVTNFKTRDGMLLNQLANESQLVLTYSYKFASWISGEFSLWSRLNNHQGYCDLACINAIPRLGVSIRF